MNHVAINKLSNLQKVIENPIYISGKKPLIDEEINQNMWALTFNNKLIQKIQIQDLTQFLHQLLQKKHFQLSQLNITTPVAFYLWFDRQALQLRFNLISESGEQLPFRCKLSILDSPTQILQNFLTTTCRVLIEGDHIEIFNNNDDDDENEEEFTLDVYVKIINPTI